MSTLSRIKKRNWAFILWPDSAPINWRDILQETGLMFAISPLHDSDINADNTLKKAHYHVIMVFDGPTTYNNAKSVSDRVGANTIQPLEQIRGYYRYFTHKDNAEKFQYNESDITTINGFDINNYVEMTYTEISSILIQLQQIIVDKHFFEYSDLLDFLRINDMREFLDVAMRHTLFLNTYISSRRYKTRQEKKEDVKKKVALLNDL